MLVLSTLSLIVILIPLAYLYLLAIGAMRRSKLIDKTEPGLRFAVAIPAHNEQSVIEETIQRVRESEYPQALYDIYVVADHCSDQTAEIARRASAVCFERGEGPKGSKGAALNWLLKRIWETGLEYDAVLFLDADSRPDPSVLSSVNARLQAGESAVQCRTEISNPLDSWYAALMWSMGIIDERLQQAGRANLGLSVRLSGYGFAVHSSVAKSNAWPAGLTEDYEYRLQLLVKGIKIAYEPNAVVRAESPTSWETAKHQQARWRTGTRRSGRRHLARLARRALHQRDPATLDGLTQMLFPSYSTLCILSVAGLALHLAAAQYNDIGISSNLILLWISTTIALILYPFLGLALERAPHMAYLAIAAGPLYVLWRTRIAMARLLSHRQATWVRTPRRKPQ